MPEPLILRSRVGQSGRLKSERVRRELRDYLRLYEGREVVIEVGPPKRTLTQNRYYWGFVIRPIVRAMREAGIEASSAAVHAYFKEKFLHVEQEIVFGKRTVIEPTTTTLSTTEFDDYCEQIKNSGEVLHLQEQLGRSLFQDPYEMEII